ncbi:unnamed protein product [Pocillopora meandrina]|uniref:Uncharacterized protein n=1 Tax=Pocillopora meandrina TaxID=46732 RepID=A0AAU9XBF3_9CNID|nr:unnamed protein product [Pocillopora meandrina]
MTLGKFEFVKSAGSNIVLLQVPRGQERSARVLKHISGQGPLCIRAWEVLSCEERHSIYEYDDSLLANDKDIRDYSEGHTLLPVSNPIAEPGPSGTDTDVAPPS